MAAKYEFDPALVPSNTREVVVLRGSWHEMGVQFGSFARSAVQINAAAAAAAAIKSRGSLEKAWAELPVYLEKTRAVFPQLAEYWQGMAEGAGLDEEDVFLTHITMQPAPPSCSTLSAWGRATENGGLLCAVNADGAFKTNQYYPAVLAYPEGANAFLAPLGLMTNTYLNDKGLVVMASAGQAADAPFAAAPPIMCAELYAAAFCATAEQGCSALLGGRMAGGGSNAHFADENGACIVEYTSHSYAVRRPGEHGEQDYLIATNHFLSETMQSALFTGERAWRDCPYRYASEERALLANMGRNTVDTLRAVMAQTRYYDGARWVDEWVMPRGEWTPENKGPDYKTYSRHLVDARSRTMYLLAGGQKLSASNVPGATGAFYALKLESSPDATAEAAQAALRRELWYAARDVDLSGAEASAGRMARLDEARACMYTGMNYANLAVCAGDTDEALALYGKAISAFCRGQCYAKMAQDDPFRINL